MAQRSPVVLVTGASSGIGRATASAFAANGYEVFGTSRHPQRIEPIPGVELVALDVTDDDSVAAAVATVLQRAGRIDILVNNAGFGVIGAAEESSTEQARQLFDTNLFGLVRMTRAVLPHFRARRSGRIVNVSSVLGFLPAPYSALYSASKHAVEGFSESLDHETRDFGVRIVAVEPGFTNTSFEAAAVDADSPIVGYAPVTGHIKQVLAAAITDGDDPSVVAGVIVKAATTAKPKLRYPAGPLARRLALLRRIAPASLLDNGIRRSFKLGSAPAPHQTVQAVR